MAKVLRSIMGRKDKSSSAAAAAAAPPHYTAVDAEAEEADDRLQGDRNMSRRVSISRSGRYKQRNRHRSGLWDNPQLVHDAEERDGGAVGGERPPSPAPGDRPAQHQHNDKENDEAGSVRSKESVRSRASSSASVLLDTSQTVAQELLDLADQQLQLTDAALPHPHTGVVVTNL